MDDYQMTGILARAMASDVGDALRRYFDLKFNDALNLILEASKGERIPALQMLREIEKGLEGMKNAHAAMEHFKAEK